MKYEMWAYKGCVKNALLEFTGEASILFDDGKLVADGLEFDYVTSQVKNNQACPLGASKSQDEWKTLVLNNAGKTPEEFIKSVGKPSVSQYSVELHPKLTHLS
jgi:hypothetical protein